MTTTYLPGYLPGIGELAEDTRADGTWWLAVTRALDALREHLAQEAVRDDGPSGATADTLWTAPHLASAAARVRHEREALRDRATLLRRRVAIVSGDPAAVREVAQELRVIAAQETKYSRHARELAWDAVSRDIGGE